MSSVQMELLGVVEAGREGTLRFVLGANGFGAFDGDVARLTEHDCERLCYALRSYGFGALADAVASEHAAAMADADARATEALRKAEADAEAELQASNAAHEAALEAERAALAAAGADSVAGAAGADSVGA